MNVLTSDFETTTNNSGNPFDLLNEAVCLAVKDNDKAGDCWFDLLTYEQHNYLRPWDLYVFFNAKFDLHWYRQLGVDVSTWTVWCCQLAEFVLSGQTIVFPSLEDTAVKYGLGHKIDVVKNEYWEKGINTDAIPREVLSEYACQDVDLTYQIYLIQLEQFKENPQLYRLFKLLCQDLLVLEEMEWNGLNYDKYLCAERAKELNTEIKSLQEQLASVYPDVPINFGSGDQLSAFLYGGIIYEDIKIPAGTFKTGLKKGQLKFRNGVKEHHLPRLVEPLPKTELKKEGFFKTNEPTLQKLKGKAAKLYVAPLLRLSELTKLVGTYYEGIPKLCEKMHWEEGMIHGQFNQCVAATGRLSSNAPNLQNMAGACQDIIVSRYD
jgi:DNA polymerase I-like protein with 3'-5' exonuclease and polymerase domains